MNQTICDAIAGRNLLQISYNGGMRTIEPHCHGISTAGNESLRAFQTGGHSNSGKPVDWKMITVAKILSINIMQERFVANRPGYNPNDKGMSSVHCHV